MLEFVCFFLSFYTDFRGFLVRCKYNPVLDLRRKNNKKTRTDEKTDKRMEEIHRKEFENFAMQVFHLNQENQKHQRECQGGVKHTEIMDEPADYVRPAGFKIIPKMLNQLQSQVNINL